MTDGLRAAVNLLGRPWTMLIVHALAEEPLRFTDLATRLDGISSNLLTERLRTLTEHGVVERTPTGTASSYGLTRRGRELDTVLNRLAAWGTGLR